MANKFIHFPIMAMDVVKLMFPRRSNGEMECNFFTTSPREIKLFCVIKASWPLAKWVVTKGQRNFSWKFHL